MNELAWQVDEAARTTLAACRAVVEAAARGDQVEEEVEQVPPESDGESVDEYDDAAEVNRFLGLDARCAEDGLVRRVAEVCRRHGTDAPTSVETLVGGVETWLTRHNASDEAVRRLRANLEAVAGREKALLARVSNLEAEAIRQASEAAGRQRALEAETRRFNELARSSQAVSDHNVQLRGELVVALRHTAEGDRLRMDLAWAVSAATVRVNQMQRELNASNEASRQMVPYAGVVARLDTANANIYESVRKVAQAWLQANVIQLERVEIDRVGLGIEGLRRGVASFRRPGISTGAGSSGDGTTGGGASGGGATIGAASSGGTASGASSNGVPNDGATGGGTASGGA